MSEHRGEASASKEQLCCGRLITEESSYEQQILNVVETMDDTKKELSLRLLNEVAQQRGDKDGE